MEMFERLKAEYDSWAAGTGGLHMYMYMHLYLYVYMYMYM